VPASRVFEVGPNATLHARRIRSAVNDRIGIEPNSCAGRAVVEGWLTTRPEPSSILPVLGNWPLRASEGPHSSTALGRVAEVLFWPWNVSMSLPICHTGGLPRRRHMVGQLEADGLEARFWIVSGYRLSRSDRFDYPVEMQSL